MRQIDTSEAYGHLMRALEQGYEVHPQWVMSVETIATLEAYVAEHLPANPAQLLNERPESIEPREMLLFLKCRKDAGSAGSADSPIL